jgi:hypothetical protein
MTTPMSDEELDALAIEVRRAAPLCVVGTHAFNRLFARIESLIAERDAAVAKLARTDEAVIRAIARAADCGLEEGERRATAAIVDQMLGAACHPIVIDFLRQWKRRDHITEAKPPQDAKE